MRLVRDDLGLKTRVTWYYVDDDAPVIPYGHPFGSRDWEFADGRGEALLGEVAGTRLFYGGQKPVELDGQNFCGSREQWERGASLLDATLPLNPTTQQQCCCGSGASLFPAAETFGLGVDLAFPEVLTDCACMNPSPARWRVSLSTIIGAGCSGCAVFNNSFVLHPVSPCRWQSDPIVFVCSGPVLIRRFTLQICLPGIFVRLGLAGSGSPTTQAIWQGPGHTWTNYGPNTIPLVDESGGCAGFPDPVTVTAEF